MVKRERSAAKLSRSFNMAPGRPFHPVASWGTLSIVGHSPTSSPRASFTNLAGLDDAASAIVRVPSPPVRPSSGLRGMQLKTALHNPCETSGGLVTAAQARCSIWHGAAVAECRSLIVWPFGVAACWPAVLTGVQTCCVAFVHAAYNITL